MGDRFKHTVLLYSLIVATIVLPMAGCTVQPTAVPTAQSMDARLNITVSIVPQKYFVERIGGDRVDVNVMVASGASPATYEPKPEQLRALSEAVAYVRIGVAYENAWMERIVSANDGMMVVDTTAGIERMPMEAYPYHEGEEPHEESEEAHTKESENLDPHIWLSPSLVKIQAQTIYAALAQLDPAHQAVYQVNLDSFLADIDALDADIRKTLEGLETRKFLVFHPAWGYFARDYGLEMKPIEVGGQEPSAAELAALITEAKEDGIRVIFAQPEFSARAAETIAQEIDGKVLLISPLNLNWMENMRDVANTFAEVLSQ